MRDRAGIVLVSVLLLTLATWAMLLAMLTVALLDYRLARGAERGAVAGAAADRAVAGYLAAAAEARQRGEGWPSVVPPSDLGDCRVDLLEVATEGAWWRVSVRAQFEGAAAWREGTVHGPPPTPPGSVDAAPVGVRPSGP